MSSINFKGKNAVWNHHLSVPYQILEKNKKLSIKGKNEDENLIIEADNLIALKSLLPKYQGRIKCIYIDPPYNIGNGSWTYNDKVNSPLIKEWFGKVVYKEDLTKHDKWLCMMTPRLKLLQELLSDDGIIFISIDDNEVHNLKQLMNEIFTEDNFIGQFTWRKKIGAGADSKRFFRQHEYILFYCKNTNFIDRLYQPLTEEQKKEYSNPDNDSRGDWASTDLSSPAHDKDPSRIYEVVSPSGKKFKQCWSYTEENFRKLIKDNLIWRGVNENSIPKRKRFLKDKEGLTPRSWIDFILTSDGKKDLEELGMDDFFEYPKPVDLIKHFLSINTKNNDVVLDSFAGSGTTVQAVLELNKKDNGNRKFILVQLPEKIKKDKPAYKAGFKYIHEITRERVKRVMEKDKTDVGFSYMKLGAQIDADSILTGKLPTYREFAKYVYYLATGKTMDNEKLINEKDYFVGKINGEAVYLIYKRDKEKLKNLAITLEWAEKIQKKDNGKKIIYAPACFLDEEYLEKFNISFVGIPYSLFEKNK